MLFTVRVWITSVLTSQQSSGKHEYSSQICLYLSVWTQTWMWWTHQIPYKHASSSFCQKHENNSTSGTRSNLLPVIMK